MLKLLRFLILFQTYSMLIDHSEVNCAKLRCSFYSDWGPGKLTACYIHALNNYEIFQGERVTIDGLESIGGKPYDEITALYIHSISTLNYFPANITNYFKNIQGIQVYNSNLQEIRQTDLMPYTKLKYLYLDHNEITTIEKNLFEFNPDLEIIDLTNNQISHIDPNIFDKLNKLNRLRLSENNCITEFTDVTSRSEVLDVIKRIQKGECVSCDYLQRNMKTQCQQNITSLKAANDELSAKVSELENYYSSLKQTNRNLLEKISEMQKNRDESKKLSDEREKKLAIAEQMNRLLQNEQNNCNTVES